MAEEERLSGSLQESILCALVFDEGNGAAVAGLVKPDLFEEPYRDIAARALEYRARFRSAPGTGHIDDLFDHVLNDPKHKQQKTYQRVLTALYEQSKHLNSEYVLTRVREFVKRQTFKAAVYKAGMRYQQGGDGVADDVEKIFGDALKVQVNTIDAGVFMDDADRSLKFLEQTDSDTIKLGINGLDERGYGPTRKELLVFVAPRKRGKSWFLIHCGKQALLQHWRTLHVSLEMSEERMAQRYYQNLFSMAKRPDAFQQMIFEYDDIGRLASWHQETSKPTLNMQQPNISSKLRSLIGKHGLKMGNLIVKQFPTKALTIDGLQGYLDYLDRVHKFVPDMIKLDYPNLMKQDPRNPRYSLIESFEKFRGICVERNCAGIAPTQSTRSGGLADRVMEHHTAEAIDIIATADLVLTYSQTEDEHSIGTARIYCSNARNDEDRFEILITQAYQIGQFVLESVPVQRSSKYWDLLKTVKGELKGEIPEEFKEDGPVE